MLDLSGMYWVSVMNKILVPATRVVSQSCSQQVRSRKLLVFLNILLSASELMSVVFWVAVGRHSCNNKKSDFLFNIILQKLN